MQNRIIGKISSIMASGLTRRVERVCGLLSGCWSNPFLTAEIHVHLSVALLSFGLVKDEEKVP